MSTGMSTLEEIDEALHLLELNGCPDITLLHCTTEYPAPFEQVNLRAMQTLSKKYQKKIQRIHTALFVCG